LVQKNKLLFWIDINLIHFGLAEALQERYDADFYAIIDSSYHKHKEFFQNQDIVKFKKIWFLHDYISKKKNLPDMQYLKSFEEKYGIGLWGIFFSDGGLLSKKLDRNEALVLVEQDCRFCELVLNEVKPDYLLIKLTDRHYNHLLHKLCKIQGIKILMLTPTRVGFRWIICEENDEIFYKKNKQDSSSDFRTINELQSYMDQFNLTKDIHSFKKIYVHSKRKSLFSYLRYYGKTIPRASIRKISNSIQKMKRESFINKNFITSIDEKIPFIYFPLHSEPERALSVAAPYYTNQLAVIFNIAQSLPAGYFLYIKEHPLMKILNWRSTSYYKAILNLPNVKLLHPSISSKDVIQKSSLVITIAGTTGFEALFYKKPVITFSKTGYSTIPSVHTIKKIEELPTILKSSLETEVDPISLGEYVKTLNENSFEIDLNNILVELYSSIFSGGFMTAVELFQPQIKLFLEKHNTVFEKLALEHIKKIKQLKKNNEEGSNKIF